MFQDVGVLWFTKGTKVIFSLMKCHRCLCVHLQMYVCYVLYCVCITIDKQYVFEPCIGNVQKWHISDACMHFWA